MGSWFRVVRTVVGHGSLWYRQSAEYKKRCLVALVRVFPGATRRISNIFFLLLTVDISTLWLVYRVSLFDSIKILVILNVST